jgi:hypothetical protein
MSWLQWLEKSVFFNHVHKQFLEESRVIKLVRLEWRAAFWKAGYRNNARVTDVLGIQNLYGLMCTYVVGSVGIQS